MNVLTNFKKIKAFVLDVDGVLTDGTLLLLEDGQMARRMNIKDVMRCNLPLKKDTIYWSYPVEILKP